MTAFEVIGQPATKGSWKAVRRKGSGHAILLADNEREAPWAERVAYAAKLARVPFEASEPVRVHLVFRFQRPAKPAYRFPARNDVDKLARSVLDALTGIAWRDDQQVVVLHVTKSFAYAELDEVPGLSVQVEAL